MLFREHNGKALEPHPLFVGNEIIERPFDIGS
jgi:hypothetical protein